MEKFEVVSGVAAPYPFSNIDTDRIIRIERCARTPRDRMGEWAFEMERFLTDGSENPSFILNRPPFREARILVAGDNFGCGSSREMAVWAVAGLGIRSVIAPSFGEIFFGNCFQNGILPIRLPAAIVDDIQQRLAQVSPDEAGQAVLTIDLRRQQISTAWGDQLPFDVDPRGRNALLEGLDPIDMTLRRAAAIDAFEARQRADRPWVWEA
jgi:3-isopropylmalate/(R)-2-methylmalate dehydratase small subunit